MTDDKEAPEVAEQAPPAKPKLTLVVALSMLLGILLTLMLAGGFVYYQRSNALHAELIAASEQLQQKSQALDEMKAQIEGLSKQMHLLKEYSIARSSPAGDKTRKAEEVSSPTAPAGAATEGAPAARVAGAAAATPAAIPPKVKKPKPKPDGQNCELVGKSAEEQAATLKRCVGAMDGGGAKPR